MSTSLCLYHSTKLFHTQSSQKPIALSIHTLPTLLSPTSYPTHPHHAFQTHFVVHSQSIRFRRMSPQEARLQAVNSFLGGDLSDLLADPDCKLFFESNGEACRGAKMMKPCMIYIVGDQLLLCRPRKIGKKYYVKYRIPVHRARIDNRSDLEMDAGLPTTGVSVAIVIQLCGESKQKSTFQIKCALIIDDHVDCRIGPFALSSSLDLTRL